MRAANASQAPAALAYAQIGGSAVFWANAVAINRLFRGDLCAREPTEAGSPSASQEVPVHKGHRGLSHYSIQPENAELSPG
jgi:hypothetical protein